ncbi:NAD(P)-dependent oxidoreductase [Thioalkalivibrio sulfidiphilus]|uniref:NAD(P)-dependent oxidoreductase n=1 Tax=Thioalkalivibrio sulfidiphilus TaxID=1033854 RepID=UPI003B2DAE6E
MKVGYIGLGIMGRPMAANLMKASYWLCVWARRPESLEPLKAAGATVAASPAELAGQVDVVFTNVSDTVDVEAVLLGENGVIHGARPGLIVVDHSTIAAGASRRMAEKLAEQGIQMLDVPVSGGEQGAIDGTLTLMVGGEAEALEKVRPLLEVVGGTITHVGGPGAGQIAKTCNQMIVAQSLQAIGEAFTLAEAADVDPARVREALLGGFAYSRILEVHGQRMLDRNYRPGFKARLHRKDMGIALQTAAELGVATPGSAVATQFINALVGQDMGELDSSALVEMLRRFNKG